MSWATNDPSALPMRPLFDAHLDLAWNALYFDRDLSLPLAALRAAESHMTDVRWRGRAAVSLPALRQAQVAVCVATVLARAGPLPTGRLAYQRIDLDYATPPAAYGHAQGQLAYYKLLQSQGVVAILSTAQALDDHWARWQADPAGTPLGIILSMEGCDPIPSPAYAEQWYADGLRTASLAHYGVGRYACGTGTDGPLTDAGRVLLNEFSRLGIALDVTHLSDQSMAEALDIYEGPVLASHHNCRALVPGDRQLTDRQIRRLVARGAVVGAAMDAWMLYPGWERGVTSNEIVAFEAVADHIDHVCQLAGNADHAAIGTDLDGGFGNDQTPFELNSIADVHKLAPLLCSRGYRDSDVDAIFFDNWLRFFRAALPAA